MTVETTVNEIQEFFQGLKEGRIGRGEVFFFDEVVVDEQKTIKPSQREIIHSYYQNQFNPPEIDIPTYPSDSLYSAEESPHWESILWKVIEEYELTDKQDEILLKLNKLIVDDEVIVWHSVPREVDVQDHLFADPDTDLDDNEFNFERDVESNDWHEFFFFIKDKCYVAHLGKGG